MPTDWVLMRFPRQIRKEDEFNVAASRAKDRLYLYRSFRREDVRENDLRARLLIISQLRCAVTRKRRGVTGASPISNEPFSTGSLLPVTASLLRCPQLATGSIWSLRATPDVA
jgi:hypothetical protein